MRFLWLFLYRVSVLPEDRPEGPQERQAQRRHEGTFDCTVLICYALYCAAFIEMHLCPWSLFLLLYRLLSFWFSFRPVLIIIYFIRREYTLFFVSALLRCIVSGPPPGAPPRGGPGPGPPRG